VLPAFFVFDRMILCPFYQKALDFGLTPMQVFLPNDILKTELTPRGTFIYGTKDDFTAREICVFTKK
jgi:hypothetical protein